MQLLILLIMVYNFFPKATAGLNLDADRITAFGITATLSARSVPVDLCEP